MFEARNWTPAEDFGLILGSPSRIESGESVGDGSMDLNECPNGTDGVSE